MQQIVCISTSNYFPIPTRKQNVMNRLRDFEIMYIDPPVSFLAPLKDKSALGRIGAYRKKGCRVKQNITVFAPPPVLPFFNKYRWVNKINQKRLARYIRKRMKEMGFVKPCLWCYSPTSCDLVSMIPNSGIIYDCVDRHSAYKGMINPDVVDAMEGELASVSSYVFCTASGLFETLKKFNENISLIPNGVDYDLFSSAASEPDGSDKTKPVFGFIGMLQDCIEYDWMEALAKAYPTGELVLVGRSLPGVDLSPLKSCPNIKFMDLVPQKDLPGIISRFDVCLNLFKRGRLSKDVSPLKLYEYLATGKPIVSTAEPLQVQDYSDVVYIADTKDDFMLKCRKALEEHDMEKRRLRMVYAKNASWDKRVGEMEEILTKIGIKNNFGGYDEDSK
jgi:glycosyltransferase involved in cell wall biosynthesis